jgi:hypothetical protein
VAEKLKSDQTAEKTFAQRVLNWIRKAEVSRAVSMAESIFPNVYSDDENNDAVVEITEVGKVIKLREDTVYRSILTEVILPLDNSSAANRPLTATRIETFHYPGYEDWDSGVLHFSSAPGSDNNFGMNVIRSVIQVVDGLPVVPFDATEGPEFVPDLID